LALRQAGINTEIISGITSGIAAPASIGIPVTHREYTHGVTFITGHTQDENPLNWRALIDGGTTLVIYMGMSHLVTLVQSLLAAGLSKDTFAAAIQHGTQSEQRQVISPIGMLPMAVKQEGLSSPAIIVVGDVVKLSSSNELINALAAAA
ncbi:MAG: SAM-dependent methyltransferase, partial [Nitrosomonadales bacterium]|nr:SAM-dependent methyltransferase [Nitrosomonadales bacterium]